jgi:hypothetical protein
MPYFWHIFETTISYHLIHSKWCNYKFPTFRCVRKWSCKNEPITMLFWILTPCGLVGGYQCNVSEKHADGDSVVCFSDTIRWYPPTSPHGVTTQKNNIVIFSAVRTSNVTNEPISVAISVLPICRIVFASKDWQCKCVKNLILERIDFILYLLSPFRCRLTTLKAEDQNIGCFHVT